MYRTSRIAAIVRVDLTTRMIKLTNCDNSQVNPISICAQDIRGMMTLPHPLLARLNMQCYNLNKKSGIELYFLPPIIAEAFSLSEQTWNLVLTSLF